MIKLIWKAVCSCPQSNATLQHRYAAKTLRI